jgi:hypothetical protein
MAFDLTNDDAELPAPEMPLAFDDDGRPVPVTLPAVYDAADTPEAAGLDAAVLLDAVLLGTTGPAEVGERVILLSFCLPQIQTAPKSFRELGARLGCSHETARRKLTALLQHLRGKLPFPRPKA